MRRYEPATIYAESATIADTATKAITIGNISRSNPFIYPTDSENQINLTITAPPERDALSYAVARSMAI